MTRPSLNYKEFAAIRALVAQILHKLASDFNSLDADERSKKLQTTRESLLEDTFRVLVLGEFSRGKSTLINAILSDPVLPAKIAPCTAVITRLCYGDRKRAKLYYRDGRTSDLDLVLMPDELKNRITIAEGTKSTIDVCEVFYPLEILRNGIEIVDSPGLNESETHTEITKKFFNRTDAVILVLNCEHAFTQSEQEFLDNDLRDRDLKDMFFVWNRFDSVRDSFEDFDDLKKLSASKLERRIGGNSRVFYVSAKEALLARMKADPTLLDRSNILSFERALEEFLTTDRGRVKLRGPVKIAEVAIDEGLNKLIPTREGLIRKPVEELRRIFDQQKPKLESAERQRDRIIRTIDRKGESIEREATSLIRSLIADLEDSIERLVNSTEVGVWEAVAREQATRANMLHRIKSIVEQQIRDWLSTQFQPILQSTFADLEQDINDELGDLLSNLDSLDSELANDQTLDEDSATTSLSKLVQFKAKGADNELGGLIHFATAGTGNLLAGVGLSVAAGVGIVLMSIPILPIAAVLGGLGAIGGVLGGRQRAEALKRSVIDEIAKALRNDVQPHMGSQAVERIGESIRNIRTEVQSRLAIRIDEVRNQVESVLRDKEQHEATASEQLEVVAKAKASLEGLQKQLACINDG